MCRACGKRTCNAAFSLARSCAALAAACTLTRPISWHLHEPIRLFSPRLQFHGLRRNSAARLACKTEPDLSAWAVLGLQPGTRKADVKARYRRLVLTEHPDRRPDEKAVADRFKRITMAYRELMDASESTPPIPSRTASAPEVQQMPSEWNSPLQSFIVYGLAFVLVVVLYAFSASSPDRVLQKIMPIGDDETLDLKLLGIENDPVKKANYRSTIAAAKARKDPEGDTDSNMDEESLYLMARRSRFAPK
eukprot:TRINITY_DN95079_c0_g1_i1.p1 TRINITY_DN95079_c0_g1~~TRINITY_DN95079_c0_g1_i1.p1  ORF type:complete len:249 (+),score=27.47 TRINITY_DN95079_c0_g1_i1:81-827(+)